MHRVIDAITQFNPDLFFLMAAQAIRSAGSAPAAASVRTRRRASLPILTTKAWRNMAANSKRWHFTKGNENPRAVAVNVESIVPAEIKLDQPWRTENGVGEWF